MTTVTLETLIGLTAVLLLFALALIVFIVRALRKGRSAESPAGTAVGSAATGAASAQRMASSEPASVAGASNASAGWTGGLQPAALSPGPVAEAAGTEPSHVHRGSAPASEQGDVLLMQVWQDRDGHLVIEVEGQRYRRLFDIRDGRVGRRVLETIDKLVAFSGGHQARTPPSSTQQEAMSRASAPTAFASETVEDWSQPASEVERQEEDQAPRRSRISLDPVPFRRRTAAQQPGLTLNLAYEIDRLVQARVDASPELGHRGIRVTSAPDGGLRFEVDGTAYSALDDVPHPEVQQLIRESIVDWEAKR